MINRLYRKALPDDVPTCIAIRARTRENAFSEAQLRALGITSSTWQAGVKSGQLPGYVCCVDSQIIGYCFSDVETGEILVLALLPDHEGMGIGKRLLQLMTQELREKGFEKLFLGCSANPRSRSYGFYRHLGWRATGKRDAAGDDILELKLVR